MNQLKSKSTKKKTLMIAGAIVIATTLLGGGFWYMLEQNHKEEVLQGMDLKFSNAYIEYGVDTVDYESFIEEQIGDCDVTLPNVEIDTKTIGTKEVVYTISKDEYSKDVKLTLEVKDTQAPEIILKEDIVTLEYGSSYESSENIESVKDIIDGDIPFVETASDNNYYMIEGSYDTSISGEYAIKVLATDKHGLQAEKQFTIKVNEEVVPEIPVVENPVSSSNNNGFKNPSTPIQKEESPTDKPVDKPVEKPADKAPEVCVANGKWKGTGNSGVAFYSFDEAMKYGKENVPEGYGYMVGTTLDICGVTGYSPHYNKLK